MISVNIMGILPAVIVQIPQNYPDVTPEPLEINVFNVLFYIVAPLLLIVVYVLIIRHMRKKHGRK